MIFMKKYLKILIWTLLSISLPKNTYGNEPNPEEIQVQEVHSNVLFVGLGSYCEAADVLKACDLRKAAFPFDWILSSDQRKLIELLEVDFLDFLKESSLRPLQNNWKILLQTHYRMEFHHEGEWQGGGVNQNKNNLILKYERRINRFRELKSYRGKVFFIRFANKHALEPNIYYKIKENLEITEIDSLNLNTALKKYFPQLDFQLIIVNVHEKEEIKEEKIID